MVAQPAVTSASVQGEVPEEGEWVDFSRVVQLVVWRNRLLLRNTLHILILVWIVLFVRLCDCVVCVLVFVFVLFVCLCCLCCLCVCSRTCCRLLPMYYRHEKKWGTTTN